MLNFFLKSSIVKHVSDARASLRDFMTASRNCSTCQGLFSFFLWSISSLVICLGRRRQLLGKYSLCAFCIFQPNFGTR
ncbi:putative ORFan [Cotonvirus japonicus]|uniref:ORFan n=1 Tax=Cotonvirus japonicus TaxID=2811091 RepID=A0ABM7NU94_9VIRU|nr:putative ORFan [Cotonvirus japonicus]BCS83758.1 putative ORFan [Cotonvirus japonicus]